MSKHALVLHRYWNRPGGGQLVCASAAYAFESMGLNPLLVSPVSIHVDKYPEWYGIDLSRYTRYSTGIELRAFGLYLRLLIGYVGREALHRYAAELIFTDEPTYKPLIKDVTKKQVKLVEYIHFPLEVSINPAYKGSGLYHGDDPYILERYSRFPLNTYWKLYTWLLKHYIRGNPFEVASAVLTNSSWTANIAREVYGESPEVLNPPLPPAVEVVKQGEIYPFDARGDSVVMVGRFSEEKRYHWVITKLLPALRRELGSVKVYVFGGAGTRTSLNYLFNLVKLAEASGFKASTHLNIEADVYLIPDALRKDIVKAMDVSKAFLHATVNEHWGIVVAEAMARGLPVIVHKSGGAWSDLAKHGEHGLGYGDVDDAVKSVVDVMTNRKTWGYYSGKSLERIKGLTMDKFVARLTDVLGLSDVRTSKEMPEIS